MGDHFLPNAAQAAVATLRLVKRNLELLGQIRDHVVRIFDREQVSAKFLVHKLPRKF